MPEGIRDMKILKAAKIAPLMLRDKGFENWCDVICDVTSRGSSGDGDRKALVGRRPDHNKHDSQMTLPTVGIFCRHTHARAFIWKFFAVL